MKWEPRKLVVFEGLDKTGKSTQADRLFDTLAVPPHVAHMPTGNQGWTRAIYRVMEADRSINPVSRQLLHLACHAAFLESFHEMYAKGLLLDRWWWSTMAYGSGTAALDRAWGWSEFRAVIHGVWKDVAPHVLFLFLETYAQDEWNRDTVRRNYERLEHHNPDQITKVVRVPRGDEDEVHEFIIKTLVNHGVLT